MLKRGVIASCQAVLGEPLYGLNMMHHMARACVEGGAVGIRANYVDDILAIKREVKVPVIGIIKAVYSDSSVYITPTVKEAKELIKTGCEVIAIDATKRSRPNGETLEDIVKYIRQNAPNVQIMADISTFEEAANADKLGFDYIGSTMRGYTEYTRGIAIPDYDLLRQMVGGLHAKIIAEGGIWEVGQLDKALDTGVYAVVIGSAITRPKDITARFVKTFEGKQ